MFIEINEPRLLKPIMKLGLVSNIIILLFEERDMGISNVG